MAQDTEKAWGEQGTTLLQEAFWRGQGTIVRLMLGKFYITGFGVQVSCVEAWGLELKGLQASEERFEVGATGDAEFGKVLGVRKESSPFAVDIFRLYRETPTTAELIFNYMQPCAE